MKRIKQLLSWILEAINGLMSIRGYSISIVKKVKKRKRSIGQMEQQLKFTITSELIKPMLRFLHITYANIFGSMAPCDKAFSYNMKNAVIGKFPNCTIDYAAVRVSKGKLYNSHSADSYSSSGNMFFTWKNLKINNASDDDVSILVVYCPAVKKCIYNTHGPLRMKEEAKLDVSEFKGHVVHTYLSFISANSLMNSDSKYTGRHIVN